VNGVTVSPLFFPRKPNISSISPPAAAAGIALYSTPIPSEVPVIFIKDLRSTKPFMCSPSTVCIVQNRKGGDLFPEIFFVQNGINEPLASFRYGRATGGSGERGL
jgi:hypothetical protein